MQAFIRITGSAAVLPAANIDTDVIMPKQFLKGIDRAGLDKGLFHALRFDEVGTERAEFVLNRAPWHKAAFLIVGPNFGCGSSREHAVWGLMQFGIRAIIGTSFAGIFFDNCARNGLLAITLPQDQIDYLLNVSTTPETCELTIDLEKETIATHDRLLPFRIDAMRRDALLNGLDAIGQTLVWRDEIRAFETDHFEAFPWLV